MLMSSISVNLDVRLLPAARVGRDLVDHRDHARAVVPAAHLDRPLLADRQVLSESP
jgi:hypothetical protein